MKVDLSLLQCLNHVIVIVEVTVSFLQCILSVIVLLLSICSDDPEDVNGIFLMLSRCGCMR